MSINVILIIVGAVFLLAGIAKMGRRQSGGFSFHNFSFNFGSTNTQTNKADNVTPVAAKPAKPDWIGLTIAVLGLITALVGLVRELS